MTEQSITFRQVDREEGIITNLPTNVVDWTTGRNIRFRKGAIYKTYGKKFIATIAGGQPIKGMFMFRDVNDQIKHLVCTDTRIFASQSTTDNFNIISEITPSPAPSGGPGWQFAIVGGFPVLSNGTSTWYWGMTSNNPTAFNPAMTAYATAVYPQAMTSWQNRLWMGSSMRVVCTGIADIFNTALDADLALKSSSGRPQLQDLLPVRGGEDQNERIKAFASLPDEMYIFTFRNVWHTSAIASPFDYRFSCLPQEGIGLLSGGLKVSVNRPQGHGVYYMGLNDVYVLSGGTATPIGFNIRNALFPNLNKAALGNAFAWYNQSTYEVFFCVPTGINTNPDTAFVYNIETKSWTICDCNYTTAAMAFDANATQWTTISNNWNNNGASWSDLTANGVMPFTAVGDTSGNIHKFDGSLDDVGSPITAYIETKDFGDGKNRMSFYEFIPDFKKFDKGKPIMIQCGSRDDLTQEINWDTPQQFTPGTTQRKINSRKEGFYLRVRIYTGNLGAEWGLDGYTIKLFTGGTR